MKFLEKQNPGYLLLSNGSIFSGHLFGYTDFTEHRLGEVVFNTAMSGYQEIVTDPSYFGQIVTMTYPHIGNYGINTKDHESQKAYLSGLVVHEYSDVPSNWRADTTLSEFLKSQKIVGISGIDTRTLTRIIRDEGAMNAYIVSGKLSEKDLQKVLEKLKKEPAFGMDNLVAKVSCKEPYEWSESANSFNRSWNTKDSSSKKEPLVVVMDFGVKFNILRQLKHRGCRVKVVPYSYSAEEILALRPEGVLLSNGPGDPEKVELAAETVANLLGKVPVFGICMGHQILARAIGAKTYKMKFGHHGANQPVYDEELRKVMISSQNHGFAIDPKTLPVGAKVLQINLNDQTVEGIELEAKSAYSVQYHPEACPGPRDSMVHFDKFIRLVERNV
ncbi:MAG: glutamine-hydrolyzing carbamoyl-phosphate synthase small subunit [Oligoflexia bacterium]|nr:glutamine-hydrolyzing carbamoyl-phosphate synthase small subunit [Oligoflexia bacterium]